MCLQESRPTNWDEFFKLTYPCWWPNSIFHLSDFTFIYVTSSKYIFLYLFISLSVCFASLPFCASLTCRKGNQIPCLEFWMVVNYSVVLGTPVIATAALNSRAISHPSSPQNSFNNCFPSQIQVISAFQIFCMCVSVHAHTCALACLSVYHVCRCP